MECYVQTSDPQHFCHQGPVLQKTIFPQIGGGGFGMAQAHSIYCALYFYYYYISSTSDHQALDPGAGDPWFTRLQVTPIHTAPVWYLAHSGHSINILNELIYT